MNLRVINIILRKELLDTLRDKRTLIMMIAVPVLLYPVMLLIGVQMALLQHSKLEQTISKVALQSPEPEMLRGWLQGLPRIEVVDSVNPGDDLASGKVDAVIVAECSISGLLNMNGTVPITIQYDRTEHVSRDAKSRLESTLNSVMERLRTERLEHAGLSEEYILPLDIVSTDVAPPQKTMGMMLGLILPMLMIVMIALGAFYPAVDLTAGEKERGTFETLLAAPVSKLEIVTGKFLAVFMIAMFTGLLNLASMAATFLLLMSQMSSILPPDFPLTLNLPIQSFLIITVVITPLAFFISAMMMSMAVFARSFKEAQNYLTPLMFLIMLPATAAGFPGVKLGPLSQLIPVANVVLLFKELMTGTATADEVFLVFLSMAVYAVLSLLLAAWLFQREEVVLSEQGGMPLSLRRSEFRPRNELTPGAALALLSLVMLAIFYGGSLSQQWRILPGLLITEWALILLPTVAFLWFVRVNLPRALGWHRVSWPSLVGTLLIAAASLLLVIELSAWTNKVMPVPKALEEAMKALFAQGDSPGRLLLLLFAVAVSPAICEETLFRGAILSGLRQKLGFWGSILVVGLLFGVFHLSIQRLLPTGLLGIVLTYLALRSGSIFPAMLMHAFLNGSVVLLNAGKYPAFIERAVELAEIEQKGLPPWLVAAALAVFAAGVLLIEIAYRRRIRALPRS
jgi:sodium transport system permease protein